MPNLRLSTPLALAALLALTPRAIAADAMRLESGALSVQLDPDFPRAIAYQSHGASFAGQRTPVSAVELNGKPAACKVTFTKTSKNTGTYRLDFPEAKAQLALGVTVGEAVVEWRVTAIEEQGAVKIHSFAFPGDALLSADTRQEGAALAFTFCTNTHDDYHTHFHEFVGLLKDVKPGADSGNYAFLSAGKLAGGVACDNYEDVARVSRTVTEKDGVKSCALQNPLWQVRAFDDEKPAMPFVKVFVVGDLNGDGQVNWQDAALTYRRNMPMPFGHECVKSTVGENIAMNFASGAQQPFLKILDELKKCALVTDGIGQQVTIKGFSSEGHDSSNSDCSGHYNDRAGGLTDFKFLTDHAAQWNARVGIHINASEVYPEARRYNPGILQRDANGNLKGGWTWLDHSAMIDKVKDTRSGQLSASLIQMKKDLPHLGYIYLDTYWENGWPAAQIAHLFAELQLPFGTEGDSALDPWTTWAHWRGNFNSQVMRFIWFSDRDIFSNDAILRGGRGDGDTFMGWQGSHSFNSFIHGTFSRHLPAKYLQNFELLSWTPGREAQFSGGVKVVKEGEAVTVTQNGRTVMTWTGNGSNSRLFVPWNPATEEKIYVWDEVGIGQTWALPPSWQDRREVFLYKLTDLGRTEETKLAVTDGKVTLKVAKNTPFVLYPQVAPAQKMPVFGEGSLVKDPGFDAPDLADWNPVPAAAASLQKDGDGNAYLRLDGEAAAEVSQTLNGLEGGKTYAASVWVQTKGTRTATIEVACGGKRFANFVEKTSVGHSAPNDARSGTNYQRMQVLFDVPAGETKAQLRLQAAAGKPKTRVEFDEVRVNVSGRSPEAAKHFFYEDFEHVTFGGYGPFTNCPGERTHLSETNKPYTQDTISGQFSLKSRDGGCVGRTVPCTLRLKPGTRYKLSCLTMGDGHLTAESKGKTVMNLKFAPPNVSAPKTPAKKEDLYFQEHGPATIEAPMPVVKIEGTFDTGKDTESYLALHRDGATDFIAIDELTIDEVGPAPAQAAVVFDDKLPGRAVLLEESFAKPLTADWTVTASKNPGTAVKTGPDGLTISAADNVSVVATRALPADATAVECRLGNDGDRGQTWGPGLCVLWPGGQQIRINLRTPDGRFNVDSTVAGEVKNNTQLNAADSVALRVRVEGSQVIAEARNDGKPWQTLGTFARDKFPGQPSQVRLGKMHEFDIDDNGDVGNDGNCAFRRLRVYGK